jgi:hypothetical protein
MCHRRVKPNPIIKAVCLGLLVVGTPCAVVACSSGSGESKSSSEQTQQAAVSGLYLAVPEGEGDIAFLSLEDPTRYVLGKKSAEDKLETGTYTFGTGTLTLTDSQTNDIRTFALSVGETSSSTKTQSLVGGGSGERLVTPGSEPLIAKRISLREGDGGTPQDFTVAQVDPNQGLIRVPCPQVGGVRTAPLTGKPREWCWQYSK